MHIYICMVVVTARDRLEFMATGCCGRSGIGSWCRRRQGPWLSGSLTMYSTKQAMLSAIDVKAALMVRVAPPTWMALRCRELVHNTVVTLTGLQLEPACWCGCCTLLLPVLAAARLALSSGLLVGVFTMAAVVLAVQVCLSSTRSLVGGKALAYVRDGDLVVCSDLVA